MKFKLKKNDIATIALTVVSSAGVIATGILAAKATPKAILLLEAEEKRNDHELTAKEKVKIVLPAYIPAGVVAVSTIACICGISIFNKKQQATIASAYATVSQSYKSFRKKVDDIYGPNGTERVLESEKIVECESKWDKVEDGSEEIWFHDTFSDQYFKTTMFNVITSQYFINREISQKGDCTENEYREYLGIPLVEGGNNRGWDVDMLFDNWDQYWLDFNLVESSFTDDHGMTVPVWDILFLIDPEPFDVA